MSKYLNPKNYIRFFISKFFSLVSPIIKVWEDKQIKKYASMPLKHQPVFIIGAPRTGSTILYQTITNQLDVLYIDNLVCHFYRNIFFGFWLSNKFFGQKAHNCFDSDHGNTNGLHSPSECGAFWYRWLPKERHFINYDDITDTMVREIRDEITAAINYFDKPLVINNNNLGLRIRLLQKSFPNAKFIIADREPLWVAQSLLKARYRFFGTYEKWWSMLPENFKEIQKFNFHKQVVYQHYFINKRMYEDLKKLSKRIGLDYKISFPGRLPFDEMMQYTFNATICLSLDKNTNVNYAISLPNKLFEYIHAEIPFLITPLSEIKPIVEAFNCGEFINHHST